MMGQSNAAAWWTRLQRFVELACL